MDVASQKKKMFSVAMHL